MTAVLDQPRSDASLDEPASAPAGGGRRAAPAGPARVRRLWIIPAAVVVVGALALLPAVRDDGPAPGEAEVTVTGTATVERAEGARSTITDGRVRLGPGDLLEVTDGSARFVLTDDIELEGRAAAAVGGRSGTTVRMDLAPELVAGPLLVVAPSDVSLRAAGSTVRVAPDGRGDGAARLDRRIGLGIGTYRGRVIVDSAGRSATIAALHRVEVASAGTLGRRDLPLRYQADDAWDRRFLGDALLVDRQLGPLLAGLAASGGEDLTSPEVLRRVLPGLPSAGLLAPLLDDVASGGDGLVLAALADLGGSGTFSERWTAAAAFRADGARWGLVALDRRVAPAELLERVREGLDGLDLSFDGVSVASGPDVTPVDGAGSGPADTAAAAASGPGALRPSDAGGATPGSDPGAPAAGGGSESPSGAPDGGGGEAGPTPDGGGGSAPPPPTGGSSAGPVPGAPLPGVTVPALPAPGGTTPGGAVSGGTGAVGGVVGGVTGTVGGATGGPVGGVVGDVGSTGDDVVTGAGDVLGGVVDGTLGAIGGAGVTVPTVPGGGGLLGGR